MKELLQSSIENAMSYDEYRSMTHGLLLENRTTGPNQSEDMVHYIKLNFERMKRLDKTIELTTDSIAAMNELGDEYFWLVITEPWCGDASQLVPLFSRLSEVTPEVDLKIVLRDENPELMDNFEINGSRAIPVLIMVRKNDFEVVGSWGARPKPAQQMVVDYKNTPEEHRPAYMELATELQRWYNRDRTFTTQKELTDFVQTNTSVKV